VFHDKDWWHNSPISCHGVAAVRPDWFTRLDYSLPALLRPGCANLASLAIGNLGSESDREDVGGSQSGQDQPNYMSPRSLTPLLERNSQRYLQKLGCEKVRGTSVQRDFIVFGHPSCEGDEYAEKLYVIIHDASEVNQSSMQKSHPQFSHRSQVVPGPFISHNCECDCPPLLLLCIVLLHMFSTKSCRSLTGILFVAYYLDFV
jgi:hypothetical protein